MQFMFLKASKLLRVPGATPSEAPDLSHLTNTNLEQMFKETSNLNCDLSGWDVSGVTGMERMFTAASKFNQDLNQSFFSVRRIEKGL